MGLKGSFWLTKLTKRAILILLVILFSTPTWGQAPLDEVEKLKIEVLNLKQRLADEQFRLASCQYQLNTVDVQIRVQSLKQAIDSTRPGFEYDMKNGVFESYDGKRNSKP